MSRRYGDAIAHSYGLDDMAPLLTTRSLHGSQISATHIVCGPKLIGMTEPVPPEDTFIVAVTLTEIPHHELWRKGQPFITGRFAANSVWAVNLIDEFSAYVFHPHESVCFYIPRAALNSLTYEEGIDCDTNLSCPHGIFEPTMVNLVNALLPAFDRPHEASAIFVDQVMIAVCVQLVEQYGGRIHTSKAKIEGGLTPTQALRAKELLANNLKGNLMVAEIAKECDIPQLQFIQAFKRTFGCTPHQWLQQRRVDKAKDMLENTTLSIGEIALLSGFADTRHLTRVFTVMVEMPPATWRRQIRDSFAK